MDGINGRHALITGTGIGAAIAHPLAKVGARVPLVGRRMAPLEALAAGRLITPDEVAETLPWLCLPASRSTTGQAIMIAGGEV